MRSHLRLLFAGLIAAVLLTAAHADSPTTPLAPLDEPVLCQIELHDSVWIEPLQLTVWFDSVLSDKRAEDMKYDFERTARVAISVREGEVPPDRFEFTIPGLSSGRPFWDVESEKFRDYLITVFELYPNQDSVEIEYLDEPTVELEIADLRRINWWPDPVRITESDPEDIWLAPYSLTSAEIEGDKLVVGIKHIGTGADHFFGMYMSPAELLAGDPPEVDLYLRHYSDMEDGTQTGLPDLEFDLTPIRKLYLQSGHKGSTVQINVYDYPGDEVTYIPVLYTF